MNTASGPKALQFKGKDSSPRAARLLLEQILKRLPRIVGASHAFARRLFLDRNTHGIKRAVVLFVFRGDPLRDWLVTFETAGRIKVLTLFAGVQVESAFRTLSDWVSNRLQQRPTLSAAGYGARSRHIQRPRTKSVVLTRGSRLLELFLRVATGVLISALTVLAVRQ